jgi:hypothetical protein
MSHLESLKHRLLRTAPLLAAGAFALLVATACGTDTFEAEGSGKTTNRRSTDATAINHADATAEDGESTPTESESASCLHDEGCDGEHHDHDDHDDHDDHGDHDDTTGDETGSDDPNVVIFRIKAGTGKASWNTEATEVDVKVGQVLRIVNDDSVPHRLHTNGKPCPHGP